MSELHGNWSPDIRPLNVTNFPVPPQLHVDEDGGAFLAQEVRAQLDRIEAKLDQLLRQAAQEARSKE